MLVTKIGFAGDCTTISRTNNSPNTVLTSTKYNSDLNTVYTHTNSLDGGCVTDGTLEDGALNTSDFGVPLNAIKQGCNVTRSDAATLSVDSCYVSVNNKWIKTNSATTVTWGCSGCASEVAGQKYYLYAAATSTSPASLDLLISTTGPNGDGFDGSNNRVLAGFYNTASGDISQYIHPWANGRFDGPNRTFTCRANNTGSDSLFQTDDCREWMDSVSRESLGTIEWKPTSGVLDINNMNCICAQYDDEGTGYCTIDINNASAGVIRTYNKNTAGSNENESAQMICSGAYFGGF